MIGEQTPKRPSVSEENVYENVYHVLLGGMFVSTALFAIGLVLAFLYPKTYPLTPEWIRSHYNFVSIWQGLKTFDPFTLMMIATAILILTPVIRVVVSIHAFWVDGDKKYVVVTSTVLTVIMLSLVLAHFGLK